MRGGESLEGLTPLEQTLVTFARKMAADAAAIDKEDIAALRAHGLGDAEIVEAMSPVLLSFVTNNLARALKFEDDLQEWGLAEKYF
ncbi:MAG: hypothetical protein HYY96_05070 [Candidatus Tectomicrobia bacterium]|nr:hypothetical protein [Candidatus Tectomicrobia bacterium]